MKKLLVLFLITLFLTGCNSENDNENLQEHGEVINYEIDISEYFPPLITRNQYRSPNDDGTDSTIISVYKYIIGEDNINTRVLDETMYSYGNVSSKATYYNVSENQISIDEDVKLMNQSYWESNESIYEIEDINRTVTVAAGTFPNCIIVKQSDKETGLISYYSYAPKVGIINITSDSPKYGEKLLVELVSTDFSPYNVSDNLPQEDTSIAEPTVEIDENYSTSPIGNAVSGKLPYSTGNSSSINANDYAVKASEVGMELIEMYLFHRPNSLEEVGTDFIWHYEEGLSLKVDNNAMLKEVYFDYPNGPGGEAFIIARALIIALDPTIENVVNDKILFSGEGITQTVGEFEVGFVFDEKSFKLLAVAK